MPSSVGPNTFGEENLVFGYDLGDVKNSYKGEPVVNIWSVQTGANVNTRSGWDMPYAYNGTISNSVYSNGTWNGNRIWEVLHTSGSSGYGGYESWRLCVDQPTAGNGTYSTTRRVAIKICVLEGSITDMGLHSGGGNGGHSAGDWTPIPESQVPRDCPVKTGWYQFLADGSWNSNSVGHCVGLGFISYNRVRILTTEPMYYPANHLIPFAGDTRSVSGSLRDLTNNSTIDLTNVSFDSNAQMTFDGTNDYVNVTGATQTLFDNNESHSFSLWIKKAGSNSGNYAYVYDRYGTYRCPGLLFELNTNTLVVEWRRSDNGTWIYNSSGLSVETGVWNFVTVTIDAPGAGATKTMRVYLYTSSGLQTATMTNTADWNAGTDGSFVVGKSISNNTYFNGEVVQVRTYSRVLTASEVKANYNAIKGRFKI